MLSRMRVPAKSETSTLSSSQEVADSRISSTSQNVIKTNFFNDDICTTVASARNIFMRSPPAMWRGNGYRVVFACVRPMRTPLVIQIAKLSPYTYMHMPIRPRAEHGVFRECTCTNCCRSIDDMLDPKHGDTRARTMSPYDKS